MKTPHSWVSWFLPGIAALLGIGTLSSCAMAESDRISALIPGAPSPQEREISNKIDEVWQRNVREVLYVGMPEEEFLKQFTKTNSWNDLDRPYIIQQSGHTYVFLQAPRYGQDKGRVTFVNGTLVKYGQFGLGENPFGYTDCTFLLQRREDRRRPK